MLDSDVSDDSGAVSEAIMVIRSKLEKYKHDKALELVHRHQRTLESIDEIADQLKDQYRREALCIIDSKYRRNSA